jgi:hypothetical protein
MGVRAARWNTALESSAQPVGRADKTVAGHARGLDFATPDNAFVRMADFARARKLADVLNPELLHGDLDHSSQPCCTVLGVFERRYHWSIMEAEYSTGPVCRRGQILAPLYEQLGREAVLSAKGRANHRLPGREDHPAVGRRDWFAIFAPASRAPASSTSSACARSGTPADQAVMRTEPRPSSTSTSLRRDPGATQHVT